MKTEYRRILKKYLWGVIVVSETLNITEDELNNIIQPHAISLEHGEKAVKEIMEYLNNER